MCPWVGDGNGLPCAWRWWWGGCSLRYLPLPLDTTTCATQAGGGGGGPLIRIDIQPFGGGLQGGRSIWINLDQCTGFGSGPLGAQQEVSRGTLTTNSSAPTFVVSCRDRCSRCSLYMVLRYVVWLFPRQKIGQPNIACYQGQKGSIGDFCSEVKKIQP